MNHHRKGNEPIISKIRGQDKKAPTLFNQLKHIVPACPFSFSSVSGCSGLYAQSSKHNVTATCPFWSPSSDLVQTTLHQAGKHKSLIRRTRGIYLCPSWQRSECLNTRKLMLTNMLSACWLMTYPVLPIMTELKHQHLWDGVLKQLRSVLWSF